jgi:hypothetical protein
MREVRPLTVTFDIGVRSMLSKELTSGGCSTDAAGPEVSERQEFFARRDGSAALDWSARSMRSVVSKTYEVSL